MRTLLAVLAVLMLAVPAAAQPATKTADDSETAVDSHPEKEFEK
jgi:hypothetical protein